MGKGAIILSETVNGSSPRTEHSFQLRFSEALTQTMMPNARIVAWTVTESGEMICDSIEVNVDASFANKVSCHSSLNRDAVENYQLEKTYLYHLMRNIWSVLNG